MVQKLRKLLLKKVLTCFEIFGIQYVNMRKPNFAKNNAIWIKVYNYIRGKILTGEIVPNQRLVETKIAKEIGTSRTPVREALHNMQQEGLIESIPRVGYRVRPVSEEEVIQVCKIREVLETLAANWAIEKEHKTLVLELKKNISASDDKIRKGDLKAFIELDSRFHETISRLSGSTHLLEITQLMRRHMLRYRIESFDHADIALRSLEGHKRIFRAIEKADLEEIGVAIRYHLDRSLRDILKLALAENWT